MFGVRAFREVIRGNEVLGVGAWSVTVSSRPLDVTTAILKQSDFDNIQEVTAMKPRVSSTVTVPELLTSPLGEGAIDL